MKRIRPAILSICLLGLLGCFNSRYVDREPSYQLLVQVVHTSGSDAPVYSNTRIYRNRYIWYSLGGREFWRRLPQEDFDRVNAAVEDPTTQALLSDQKLTAHPIEGFHAQEVAIFLSRSSSDPRAVNDREGHWFQLPGRLPDPVERLITSIDDASRKAFPMWYRSVLDTR